MGNSIASSMSQGITHKVEDVKNEVRSQVLQQMKLQREVQMAVNLARARDGLQWWGGLYAALAPPVIFAALSGKTPKRILAPVILGGFSLANMYDMAYGNKLVRITQEAELILAENKGRMVPPKQLPFYDLYSKDEQNRPGFEDVEAVGHYWPAFLPFSRNYNEE
jgi:hypothetical protein